MEINWNIKGRIIAIVLLILASLILNPQPEFDQKEYKIIATFIGYYLVYKMVRYWNDDRGINYRR